MKELHFLWVCVAAGCFTVLFLLDTCLKRTPVLDVKTRWFLLHIVGNVMTVVAIWDEVFIIIVDPLQAYVMPTRYLGYCVVVTLHCYHIVFFKMRPADWFHHLVFVGGGFGSAVILQPYIISSMPLFSLNGLPGALDYAMLVAVRLGRMKRLDHKWWNARINTWFRCPYSVMVCGVGYVGMVEHGTWQCAPCLILVLWNAVHYGEQAVENATYCAAHEANGRNTEQQTAAPEKTQKTAAPVAAAVDPTRRHLRPQGGAGGSLPPAHGRSAPSTRR